MITDPHATPVLFIDDELAMRVSVTQWLQLAGFAAQGFETPQLALDLLAPDFPGVLVTDVRMPRMDGMAVLERALERDADLPVILVTGHGDVALAVEAMRRGAYDFIEKPFEPDHLVAVIRRAAEKRRLVLENRGLRRRAGGGGIESKLIGTSPAIAELRRDLIDLAAVSMDGAPVGRVVAVHNFGAGDVIEIAPPKGATLLLPFTDAVVPTVDIAGGRVVIDLPGEVDDDTPDQA